MDTSFLYKFHRFVTKCNSIYIYLILLIPMIVGLYADQITLVIYNPLLIAAISLPQAISARLLFNRFIERLHDDQIPCPYCTTSLKGVAFKDNQCPACKTPIYQSYLELAVAGYPARAEEYFGAPAKRLEKWPLPTLNDADLMTCLTCNYNLRGAPRSRCPECNTPFDRNDPCSYGPKKRYELWWNSHQPIGEWLGFSFLSFIGLIVCYYPPWGMGNADVFYVDMFNFTLCSIVLCLLVMSFWLTSIADLLACCGWVIAFVVLLPIASGSSPDPEKMLFLLPPLVAGGTLLVLRWVPEKKSPPERIRRG